MSRSSTHKKIDSDETLVLLLKIQEYAIRGAHEAALSLEDELWERILLTIGTSESLAHLDGRAARELARLGLKSKEIRTRESRHETVHRNNQATPESRPQPAC